MKSLLLPLTLIFLLLQSVAVAQQLPPGQVHTYVNVDSLQVGDMFEYTLVVSGFYDTLYLPGENAFDDIENLEMISRQRFQVSEQRDSLVYRLQFFGTENLIIPRKEIILTTSSTDTTLFSNQVPIYFKTTLAEGDEEFRPFKPIFDFARALWPWLLLILFLCIAAWVLYRWKKSRPVLSEPEPVQEPEPFPDPLKQLEETLASLHDVYSLKTREEFETFYIRLGDAIRLYLKRVYQIQALEMTTREIHIALQKELAPTDIIAITKKVLNEADIVKFANFQPGSDQADNALTAAQHFLKTAKDVDHERIKYLKYKYDVEHGFIQGADPAETEEVKTG